MLAILDVVDIELFDPDLEGERQNDFFLREEVDFLVNKYEISQEVYDLCYKNSKNIKYLFYNSDFQKNIKK